MEKFIKVEPAVAKIENEEEIIMSATGVLSQDEDIDIENKQ